MDANAKLTKEQRALLKAFKPAVKAHIGAGLSPTAATHKAIDDEIAAIEEQQERISLEAREMN